jgi:ABC-type polysaccharide/polyol phosphate export permease
MNTVTMADTAVPAMPARATRDPLGHDIYEGLGSWRLWSVLGWNDIRRRYRRSILGPLWMTLSMSLLVGALGFLYSHIFRAEIQTYLPYLTLGFVVWAFISTCVKESCQAFGAHADLIKQINVPFSIHVLRVLWANVIVFLHTIVIIVPIWIYFRQSPQLVGVLALPGLLLITLNLVWVGIVLAILNARFRDISQIVETFLQIAVFATPIMWPVSALGEHAVIVEINPIYHLIELVRAPLTGHAPTALSWMVTVAGVAVGLLMAALLLRRVERRIVYWL